MKKYALLSYPDKNIYLSVWEKLCKFARLYNFQGNINEL